MPSYIPGGIKLDYDELIIHHNGSEFSLAEEHIGLKNSRKIERKFKPQLGASPWWIASGNVPRPTSYIDMDLARLQKMGIDTIPYLCHVYINAEGNLYIAEGLDNFTYAYSKAQEFGIEINAIKMHFHINDWNAYIALNKDVKVDYKALMQSVCVLVQNKVTYFTVLNEVPDIYWADEYQDFVIDLLSTAKSYGFKVGCSFSGERDAHRIVDNDWMLPYIDVACINYYPEISFKGSKTTYQDSIEAWKHMRTVYMFKYKYNKLVIVSECGVQHFWECLSNPSRWDWTGFPQTDAQGGAARMFLYGLLNSAELNETLTAAWLWYPEQMHYQEVYDLINAYTGGMHL